jgi:hypothetical protein
MIDNLAINLVGISLPARNAAGQPLFSVSAGAGNLHSVNGP